MTDIAGERRRLAAVGLEIEHREAWGASFDYSGARDVDRPASALFLHVAVVARPTTATPAAERAVMRVIERIGIERFPATGISYNAGVMQSGRLYEGQPLTRRGAHTLNDEHVGTCPVHGGSLAAPSDNLNVNARAIVLAQNVGDEVTDAQVDAIARWGAALILAGEVKRGARWHGHRDVSSKDCPGSKGFARIPEIQELTEHYVANGLDDMATPEEIADAVYKKFQLTNVTNPTDEADPQARSATLFELAIVATRRSYAALLASSTELISYNGVVYLRAGMWVKPVPGKPNQLAALVARHGQPRAVALVELELYTNLNTVLAIQSGTRTALDEGVAGLGGGMLALQTKADALASAVAGLVAQVGGLDLELDEADAQAIADRLAAALPTQLVGALANATAAELSQRLAHDPDEPAPAGGTGAGS